MNPTELLDRLLKARRIISDLFVDKWLKSSTGNELQTLWERSDRIAYTEILIFGDCLEKCKKINEKRTKDLVKKIKKSHNHNERK